MVGTITAAWHCRHFLVSLVQMDLRARYRRSLLGLGWSLLNPVAMAVLLGVVFHSIFRVSFATFFPFLLSGLVLWGFLTGSVGQGCQCYLRGSMYLRQAPVPLALFPLRAALGCFLHLLPGLALALLLAAFTRGMPGPLAAASLLPAALLLFSLGWALALLAGLATVYFQDTEHLSQIALQALFYLTPVLYPPEIVREHGLSWLMALNPLVAFLDLVRAPLLEGRAASGTSFAVAVAAVVAAWSAAQLTLVRVRDRLVFHL